MEDSISQSSPVGKQNFAVLLLSTRLGLRASDIAGLCFSNIDWENSLITLEQYKTKNEIRLPLLTEVGEAIIAYLKFGRPKSETTNIFLSARALYRHVTGHAVSTCVRQQIDASHVCVAERRKGPHAMRHSLASSLLEQNVSLPIISEALGYQTTDATMAYLRIDMQILRKCALDKLTLSCKPVCLVS